MFILEDVDGQTEIDHSQIAELLGRIVEASNELAVLSESYQIDEAGKRTILQTADLVMNNLAKIEGNVSQ